MLTSIKQRFDREDEGFTLIELMVVLLIIAILLAIAIPTFLGARNTANARSMQENLRNALTAEQTYWTNNQAFSNDVSTTGMPSVEPSLTWTTTAPTQDGGNSVVVQVVSGDNSLALTGFAKDGNCYYIEQNDNVSGSQTGYAEVKNANGTACSLVAATASFVTPSAGSASGHAGAAGAAPTTFYTTF